MPDLETRYHDPRDHRRKGREYPRGHRAVTQPQGVSFSVCLLCWRGRGGLQYIGLSEDVEESDWSSTPVGYNVVYDVAVNL